MKKKMLFVIATIVVFALFVPNVLAATVTTEEQFVTAISEGSSVEIKNDFSIKLSEDITIANKVTIGAFSGNVVSMTIDLNGHTIKLDGSNAQLFVQKKGKLIIEDSVGNGLITNGGATKYSQYPIQIAGSCEINGGTLENALPNLTAVYVQNETAVCTLNDGTIINSYTKGGRTVKVNKATFIMNGGKVESKASGSDGLTPAIEGNNVIMNGGTIEAAGTGITATASNVEITGGTINAGWFGLHTRYATINPDEGKEVNISAGRAAIIAYSAPSTGKGNKIYGGNFEAPILMESKYVCDATNVEVHGGLFNHDVSEHVVDGKYAENKEGIYEIKGYSQKVEITPIDPEKETEETTLGLTEDETTEDTLFESLDKEASSNTELQEAIKNNHVVVVVDVDTKEASEVLEEVLEEIEKVANGLVIADYFDIKVLVNDDEDKTLGIIPELTKEIELMVLLPEKLINTDEKINRKYYVIREHDGEVEIIEDVKVSDDGKSLIFKSNKFSTYALAYEDEVIQDSSNNLSEGTKEELPPKTGDINLAFLIGTILVGTAGAVIISKKRFAKGN